MEADEALDPAGSGAGAGMGARAGKAGVVVVDDHAMVRQGLAALVNAEADLVVLGEAEGAEQALGVIAATEPALVVVDLSLKDGDGLELIRQIRERWPGVLTLVLSMYDENVFAERALRAGARGYVRKVDVAQTVLAAMRKVLAGEVYLSPGAAGRVVAQVVGQHRPAQLRSGIERLSERELQVLQRIGRGLSNREIAADLFISVKTVETHREHLKQKLELPSSGDLLRYAIEFERIQR